SHYLKMNNILSNALKNTEATEQTKFYKLSETDFKSKFESHLKTTGCDADAGDTNFTPNVCLADGSQFAYGTFDESCTDNICDTLTIDTNGKKGPNTAGKDRFTMNLTPNGLKALGESNSCETGLDCGAYILAHHKLWTGEVETAQTPVIPEGCADAQCTSCLDGNVGYQNSCIAGKTITNGDYETPAYKVTLSDGTDIYMSSIGRPEATQTWRHPNGSDVDDMYNAAVQGCIDRGMTLATKEQLTKLSEQGELPGVNTNLGYWALDGSSSYYHSAFAVTFKDNAGLGMTAGVPKAVSWEYGFSSICVASE
ncbi:hypothetical protein IJ732_03135, partial [bacterium]|nr:hypothetical protein [bacterium]